MLVSMAPNEEVKTIHASLNDGSLRKWEFEPYTENGKIELTDQDYATIQSIKGNTVKFNQLIAQQYSLTLNRDTARTVNVSTNNTRSIPGHKYYIACTITKDQSNRGLLFQFGFDTTTSFGNGVGRKSLIFQPSYSNALYVYMYISSQEESGVEISFNDVILSDLTAIFGSGNEPSVSDFETWLSNNIGLLPYYDYTPGTLIPFKGTGLKTENASQTENNTLSLPISTYFPTGMKDVPSIDVYDELTESKAITRVESRAYQSGDESDTSVITDGTTTYYALATPTSQDISLDLTYPIWDNGTEQILPVNGSTPTTSSMVATIEYPDRTEDVNFLYKQTTFESAIPQFSLVCKNQELPMTLEDGKLICECDSSITNESGFFDAKVKMQDLDSVAYSQKIQLHVERGIND